MRTGGGIGRITRAGAAAACVALALPQGAAAQKLAPVVEEPEVAAPGPAPRRVLGFAAITTNDDIPGTTIEDRWRSGALSLHLVHGRGWTGAGPVGFGEVLEFRARAEIITPESVDDPQPGDRPYAGALTFGVHSHMRRGLNELRLGAEVVVTGPQTGLSDLQENLHELQDGLPDPSAAAEDQIGDAAYFALSGEVARPFTLGAGVQARPFAAARAGDETFARAGVDLVGGSLASGGLLLRDPVTGQLVEAVRGAATGFGWSAGLDVAAVAGSVYLPDEDGVPGPEEMRGRARLGAAWAGERWAVTLGAAYLTEEFDGQDEGQVVGALGLTFGF
jgi:hypothetical protein